MKNAHQTTVLGKRKNSRQSEPLILHLSPPPTSTLPEQFDSDSSFPVASGSRPAPILVNGSLVLKTKKCYRCTFEGCEKAYTKPTRLEEHERSHTGQRPFVCNTCGKSYLRETHLHAHSRSHLPETARPFSCERPGCEKRFWTSQHLQAHHSWHDGAKPYKCSETECHEAFSKHHLLRAHICEKHAPPGTKPYRCEHDGCAKSFDTNQHLRSHHKTHDDKRYTCVHANCLAKDDSLPRYFPTWSALQSHIRTDHPPACFYPSCNGRTFSNPGNLRAHLKLHEQRDAEMELDGYLDSGDDSDQPARKRRRGGEHGRDWKCEVTECGKDFKSKKALNTHVNVNHLGKRDFICHHADCGSAFGYKHLLQRHLAKIHFAESVKDLPEDESSPEEGQTVKEPTTDIDAITGYAYLQRSEARLKDAKAMRCPFPELRDLADEEISSNAASSDTTCRPCEYVFSRAYDLRRHLAAAHDVVIVKESVEIWVRKRKKLARPTCSLNTLIDAPSM
ncbi:hypothetical protein CPB84DRAFT_1782257 [Gymnopilus junonius]|uniref:C2H2-type domain-containing protein n=1 Tax=Gymnopilus junonius TaxID=109634 RepID=A0A9P5NL76_GYMJU|nr:hypothetical protein CPB84DRAFT_1782257 [Gymnopilus junonius]